MLKKALMTTAAALAITVGASAVHTPSADAGWRFSVGLYAPVHAYGHGYSYSYAPICHTKYKKVRIKFWTHYGPRWKTIYRAYKVCH